MIRGPRRGRSGRAAPVATRRSAIGVIVVLVAVGVPFGAIAVRAAGALGAAGAPAPAQPALVWGAPRPLPAGAPHSRPLIRTPSAGARVAAATPATSRNWSGYVEQGGPFTSVSASWTVPTVVPSDAEQSSATWIGIDGVQSSSLIQTGTGQDTAAGQTSYYAWFEVLPQPAQLLGGVSPGDAMQASITESAPGSNSWTISIADVTSKQQFSPQGTYLTPGQAADWIEEAPTGSSGILPLADFGTMQFTGLQVNGGAPVAADMQPVTMLDAAKNPISEPGAYDAASNSFTVSYTGPAPTGASTTTTSTTAAPVGCAGTADHVVAGQATAIAAMEAAGGCGGYWVVTTQGQVVGFGAAPAYGDLSGAAHAPVIDIIATPTGLGYWLATSDGAVHAYGDAVNAGDMSGKHLNGSIIAMAATPDGRGYWLVGSDGGIFNFGDARFFGSTGAIKLNRPVVGIAPAPAGAGYWLVASDGGVFAFGAAPFLGSMGATHLNRPVAGMTSDPLGRGYRMVGADGGIFSFGAPFYGSLGSTPPAVPITTMAPSTSGSGYYLLGGDGSVYAFGDATYLGRA